MQITVSAFGTAVINCGGILIGRTLELIGTGNKSALRGCQRE